MAPDIDQNLEAKTSIDSLLELLKEKGKTDLNTVSISLGVSPTIVEEWAKVLENGKLIRVSYEVGKMYLEPLTDPSEAGDRSRTAIIKTDAQKAALLNEMEVENITLDKYSKNLEDLSATVVGMENIYRQKLPSIQKIFSELDNMSAPMAKKTKELEATKTSAESYFSQLDKKVDELYVKVNALETSNVERAIKQKEEMLKIALTRADAARSTLIDLEDTKGVLYQKISWDIDQQVKEFKAGLRAQIDQIYGELKADAAEAVSIDKEIRTELAETSKIANEAQKLQKDAEAARVALLSSRNLFKDKYAKTVDEIEATANTLTQKYSQGQLQLNALKESMGDVSKLHDTVENTKIELDTIRKQIEISKQIVSSIVDQLKALDTAKNMDATTKAKAVSELSKQSLGARLKGEKIKRSIKETTTSIQGQSQSKPDGKEEAKK